jgi:predicted ATP-grasp superfamily ATP-dependent carboligase
MPARSPFNGGGGASSNPPAILLGGGVIALAVARSLSRAGVAVYALGHERDPVRWSRHRELFVDTGAGTPAIARWLEWLKRGPGEGVVLPCCDEGLELIVGHRPHLEGLGYTLTEGNDEVTAALLDKELTYEIAKPAGVAMPRTVTLNTPADVEAASEEVGFPCAVKPRSSHRFAEHYGVRQKVLRVADADELRRAYFELEQVGVAALATEIVPGPDRFVSCYGYLDDRGESLFTFTKQKLRQFPPRFGQASYHVTDWNPEVADAGLRFFQGIGLRGFACVEFKRDERDGRLMLIESNPRFTAATELLHAAGADVALLVYNRLLGRPLPSCSPYRTGLHLWIPGADVRAAREYRRAGDLTWPAWVRSLLRPQRLPVASLDDPGAVLGAIAHKLPRAPRKLGGLLREARAKP